MKISKKGWLRCCRKSLSNNEYRRTLQTSYKGDCRERFYTFLWVTFPQLQEGIQLLKSWGFTYKTVAFVWVKLNKNNRKPFFGLGYWTRSNAEICLLGVKGKPKRISRKVHQLIMSPIQRHSQKPEEAREKIVELMGDLPKVELFARNKADGWDVWDNEVQSDLQLEETKMFTLPNKQDVPLSCEAKDKEAD